MADTAISALTALGAAPATDDLFVVVDVSDHTQAPTGTTKNMTVTNLFTSPSMTGPTVASGGLTITAGGLTVTAGGLTVSAGATAVQALTSATGITVTTGGLTVSGGTTAVNALTATTGTFSVRAITDEVRMVGSTLTISNNAGTSLVAVDGSTGSLSGIGTLTIANGGDAAESGAVRLANASTGEIRWRNNANTADVTGIGVDSNDVITIDGAGTAGTRTGGTLAVAGDVTINTNKVTVAASTGNTAIAGTLGVTGVLTASGGVVGAVTGNASTATALANARTIGGVSFDGTANITVATATGGFTVSGGTLSAANASFSGTLAVTGAITATGGVTGNASTATALANARTIGGVSFDGTANITVASATGGFTVSGGTLTAAATAFSGDLAIATNKFTVASASGDTSIAGTLIVTGAIQSTAGTLNIFGQTDIGGNLSSSANINTIFGVYQVGGTQVVSARNTGWSAQTATPAKTNLGASPTVGALASWAAAIQAALTTHGLIGT